MNVWWGGVFCGGVCGGIEIPSVPHGAVVVVASGDEEDEQDDG